MCNSYSHRSQISPGRKSLHEPLFVSDGFTIRCDPQQSGQAPQHTSLHRQDRRNSRRREGKTRRRQTLPSGHLLAKQERDTQTKQTETQTIQTQTSVEIAPQQAKLVPTTEAATTTTTAIVELEQHQGASNGANGARPKHSRKKSLPESSFLSRTDSSQPPYEMLTSPSLRPRSTTYKEVNSRPHSSISMVYTLQDAEDWAVKKKASEAAMRTERLFHTLERESSKVGRHPHPGQLETVNLTYESYESVELSQQASSELDILECLTPAPYQFTDDVEFPGESLQHSHSNHCQCDIHPDTAHSNEDLTHSGTSDSKYRRNGGNTTYHKEIHPHSRSTETILFHNDKDSDPMVPNKKPGTPDIWLPRTIRA